MRLKEFECPNCGAIEMETDADQRLTCLFCGSSFGEVTRICPECGLYNEEGARHCARCGAQVVRDCPACGAGNWSRAEHCAQCGRNLDLIGHLARRWEETTEQRLHERAAAISVLKEGEERASQARMAELMEAERIRQEALALARESQRERDRRVYVAVGIALLVFVCIVLLAFVLGSGGG